MGEEAVNRRPQRWSLCFLAQCGGAWLTREPGGAVLQGHRRMQTVVWLLRIFLFKFIDLN